jgi:hypothetical protein
MARHRVFWKLEDVEKPLLKILSQPSQDHPYAVAPSVAEAIPANEGAILEPEMILPEKIYRSFAETGRDDGGDRRETIGDVFAVIMPYFRVPWVEAILGCQVQVSPSANSLWSRPYLSSEWFARNEEIHIRQDWIERLVDFTRYLVQAFGNRFGVTQTLMRGPSDLLSAILGPENAVKALYRHRSEAGELLERLSAVFVEVAKAQYEVIPNYHGGYFDLSGVWAPGATIRTQDDASMLMSPKMYEDLILPLEEKICSKFEYSTIHLHSASLHIVDQILGAKYIRGVEVDYDFPPFGPSLDQIMPTLVKIQKSKPLLLEGPFTEEQIRKILSFLSPRGLLLAASGGETWNLRHTAGGVRKDDR